MVDVPGQVPVIPSTPTGAGGVPLAPANPAAPAAPAAGAAPADGSPPAVINAPWTGSADVWKVGEPGKEQPWWSAITEQPVRDHIAAHQYKNPGELAMANFNLTKLQRGASDVIAMPAADAPKEVMDQFYTKLGRPADVKGYDTLKFDSGLPQGQKPDDNMVAFSKQTFLDAGLNPKQAQTVVDTYNKFYVEQTAGATERATKENNDAVTALETRWGATLDENKAAGRRALEALGPEAAPLIAKVDGAIGAAAVVELLAMIGKKTSEGGFQASSTPSNPNDPATMTKEAAQQRISQLNADPAFQKKYTTKNDPEHADAVKQMSALYARL